MRLFRYWLWRIRIGFNRRRERCCSRFAVSQDTIASRVSPGLMQKWIIGGALATSILAAIGVIAYNMITEELPVVPRPPPVAPPAPPTPAPDVQPVDPVVRITRYVNGYDGGECFFISPVRVAMDSAGIEGFAKSADPFEAFDQAFSKNIEFSPDITGQKVWVSQCPAVDFLRRVRGQEGTTPILELRSIMLRSGQSMAGEIRDFGNQSVNLLQVQDDGLVRNVSAVLREDQDAKVFDLQISREGTGGPFPQMLVVVVSSQPLAALETRTPVPADKFFPAVLKEVAAKGQKLGATAKLFLLRS